MSAMDKKVVFRRVPSCSVHAAVMFSACYRRVRPRDRVFRRFPSLSVGFRRLPSSSVVSLFITIDGSQ